MNIWISPIINSVNVLVSGVTVKLLRDCQGEQYCTIFEGRGYYRTTNTTIVTDYGLSGATFTPNPLTVLKTSATHAYTFNALNLLSAFIEYPDNYDKIMPLTCTTAGTCLIFPRQRKIVAILPGTTTSALSLLGLVNGKYLLPDTNIFMKLASLTNLDKYEVYHNYLQT